MKPLPAPVEVVPYDSAWPAQFSELAAALSDALGDVALRIEHVGSTSVPGLPAKPIIDVDVVIAGAVDLPRAVERLAAVGYTHQGDLGVPGRDAFKYEGDTVPRDGSGRSWPTHHLYVCVDGVAELVRHVAFRDYLIAHPGVAHAYGELKLELAVRFRNDRPGYNEAKTDFVRGVYTKAGAPAV
jgi:GrpB-like predicted nucleotidyltransferase (UPF0157 family)